MYLSWGSRWSPGSPEPGAPEACVSLECIRGGRGCRGGAGRDQGLCRGCGPELACGPVRSGPGALAFVRCTWRGWSVIPE